jgi:hypothetical protein
MVPASAVDGIMNDCGQQFPDPGSRPWASAAASARAPARAPSAACAWRRTCTTRPLHLPQGACADARILHRALQGPAAVLWGPPAHPGRVGRGAALRLLGLELDDSAPGAPAASDAPGAARTGRPGHEPDPALRSGRRRHRAGGMAAAVFASARGLSVVRRAAPGPYPIPAAFSTCWAPCRHAKASPARPVERPFEPWPRCCARAGTPTPCWTPKDIRLAFHEVMTPARGGLPYRAGGETNFLLPTRRAPSSTPGACPKRPCPAARPWPKAPRRASWPSRA